MPNFRGHLLGPTTHEPSFRFRVGQNEMTQTVSFTDDGRIEFSIHGQLKEPQKFAVEQSGLAEVKAEGGTLKERIWTLDPKQGPYFQTECEAYRVVWWLVLGLIGKKIGESRLWFRSHRSRVVSRLKFPEGYSVWTWESPKDLLGRDQLFEPTGIAVAKNGTIVISTRTAGIWRIKNRKWSLFAEGGLRRFGSGD